MLLTSPGWRRSHIPHGAILGLYTTALVAGALLSASVLWLVSGAVTPIPMAVRYALALGLGCLAVARDLGFIRFPLPQNERQIPQWVLAKGRIVGPLQFGIELGTGFRTLLTSTAPYVLAAALVLLASDFATAILSGVGFGLGRAVTVWQRYAVKDKDGYDLQLGRRTSALVRVSAIMVLLALIAISSDQA